MAGKNEARIKFTAETQQFSAQVKNANSALASLRAGLKLNDAELKNNGDQTEYLKNKQKLLQAELEVNKSKQDALNGKLEAAKQIYGEDSAEVENWSRKLTQAKTEQQQLEAALNQTETAMREQTEAEERAQSPLEQLNNKISEQHRELEQLKTSYKNVALEQGTDSQAAVELKDKIDQLNHELDQEESKLREVDAALDDAGDSAQQSASGGWSVLGQVVADLASNALQQGIDKLKEFATSTMQLGIDFSASMSNVQAISGATDEEFDQLTQTARDLGSTTIFSASDVADAFGYMAMAGWDTSQMIDGVKGVLDLAAASGEDLATTSDIVTDAMTAFGLSAEESGHFADVLAKTSSSCNTNVGMLGESFKYVAPVAGAMGYSVEDINLALGLMANSGVKASSAGTALRNILTNMANPTNTMADAMDDLGVSLDDGNGNMLTFKEVMDQLRSGFDNLKVPADEAQKAFAELDEKAANGEITEKQYAKAVEDLTNKCFGAEGAIKAQAAASLAGKNGLSGLMAIVSASDEDYAKLTAAIGDCDGAALTMSDTMNDNLGGDIKEMNSALEEFKLKLYDGVENPMRNIVQFVTGSVIPAATQVLSFIQQHSTAFAVLAGILGIITTAMLVQSAAQAIQTAMNAAEVTSLGALISAKLASAAASWAALAPYILIVAAIAAVIAIIVLCVRHWDQIKAKMTEVANIIKSKITEAWNAIKTVISTVMEKVKSVITTVWGTIKSAVSAAVNAVKSTVSNVFNTIKSVATTVWNAIKAAITNPIQAAKSLITNIFNTIRSTISNVVNTIKSVVTTAFNAIKSAMTKPIETARSTIKSIMDKIKGFFPLKIGNIFSNLKLPHISVSAGKAPFGIGGKGSLPSFHVNWRAKGVIFDAPTLIPTLNGVEGVGEAGPEAVSPISLLQNYVSAAVQRFMPQPIDYDLLGEKVAMACAKMNITMEVNDRELGRVVREVV